MPCWSLNVDSASKQSCLVEMASFELYLQTPQVCACVVSNVSNCFTATRCVVPKKVSALQLGDCLRFGSGYSD